MSSNGSSIKAIPLKSSSDITKARAVVASRIIGKRFLPIILKEHKYLAYMLFRATAVVRHEKIIIIAIISAPFVPST